MSGAPLEWACPVCGGTAADPLFPVPEQGTEGGVDGQAFRPSSQLFGATVAGVVRCRVCGHGAVLSAPDPAAVRGAYEDAADEVSLREEPGQVETARRALAAIERVVRPGRMVDLGCWTGSFVTAAAERGWEAEGIEPSAWAVQRAQERGLQVCQRTLEDHGLGEGRYRLVVMGDVLEHLADPGAAVDAAARLLEPGGALYLTVPDAGSALARALGRRWWSVLPMHLQYFTRGSLRRLLEGRGLTVRSMTSHAKVFSARYYAERLGGYGPALERLSAAAVDKLRVADRLVGPDFHDRVAVIAQLAPAPACPVCAGPAEDAFVVKEWRVSRCLECGHRWLADPPPPDTVATLYGEDYFANPSFRETDDAALFGYMDYHRDREHIQARLRGVLERAGAYTAPGRLLDVGCGPGFFVEAAHKAGWDAWGAELNKHAVAWANEHGLEQVEVGALDHLDHADASFDCVTMFDVIEHVHDPRAGLIEAGRVLRPGGVLVLITPDAGSAAARVLGPRWLEYRRAPEHLHFFTRDSLARLLRDTGFTPLDWRTVGKTTTVETLLADLKFSAPRTFRAVDRAARRLGLADRTVSVDPRTKMCVYARRL